MWIIGILLSTLIAHVFGCGYARRGDNYYPLGACIFGFNSSFSFYHQCYGQDLNDVVYFDDINCAGTPAINDTCYAVTGCDEPYCHVDGSCDYVEFMFHVPNKGKTMDCNSIASTTHKDGNALRIINKCLFQPSDGLYKLDTCTDSHWTTFFYTDSNCDNVIYKNQFGENCVDGSVVYGEITQCTAPLNRFGDRCGYVQYDKNNFIAPLDQCFVVNEGRNSYKFTCINDEPYLNHWYSDNACNSSITPDVNVTITPFSFSCANQCDYTEITTYDNINHNCSTMHNNVNFTKTNIIINECFHWFDVNHQIKSSIFVCDEINGIVYENVYATRDCDESLGIYDVIPWSEQCDVNSTSINKIKCNLFTTPTSVYTNAPISLQPTVSPVIKPTPMFGYDLVYYVSANGSDEVFCGDRSSPCGTLYYATNKGILAPLCSRETLYTECDYNSSNLGIALSKAIIVQGQNPTFISITGQKYKVNPCVPHELFSWSDDAAITFDPKYIHEMKDWYPTDLCEAYESTYPLLNNDFILVSFGMPQLTTFTVNNLIIDSYQFSANTRRYLLASGNKLICNECKFINITIDSSHRSINNESALIYGRDMSFYNCLFENITYLSSDLYDYSFIKIDSKPSGSVVKYRVFNLKMMHSTITGINMLNYFISLNPSVTTWGAFDANFSVSNVTFELNTLIQYNIFDQIRVVDALFYHHPSAASTAYLDILDTNIFNLNLGSVLHLVEYTSIVNISNINISTAQTIQQYISTKESLQRTDLDLYSLFVIESAADIININNVNIMYHYWEQLFDHCDDQGFIPAQDWYAMELFVPDMIDFWLIRYTCDVPVQFIDSAGSVNINGLTVRNDIYQEPFEALRNALVSIYQESFGTSNTIYIDFIFDNQIDEYAFIYNEGTMDIKSFNIYGAGVHFKIINSPSGSLFIDEMNAMPQTYCQNENVCNYNPDHIQISYWITFGPLDNVDSNACAAELNIKNSIIYGQKMGIAIDINSGYAYINNITIQNAMVGIAASSTTEVVEVLSSHMVDIGKYYASAFSYLRWYDPGFVSFKFGSGNTIIKDTVFSFVDPYQFDMFDQDFFNAIKKRIYRQSVLNIILVGNTFEINDQNVVVPYPFNQSFAKMESFTSNENLEFEYDNIKAQYFLGDGMFVTRDNQDITMINNEFVVNQNNLYVDESILLDNNIPWIYAKNSNGDICMSGNEFTNYAIQLTKGEINSCVKSGLKLYFGKKGCKRFGTFGSNDIVSVNYNMQKPNLFNVKSYDLNSIMNLAQNTYIALYNNVINIHSLTNTKLNNKKINIMNIEYGNYLLVDTVINGSSKWDINISPLCTVLCYSTLRNNPQIISMLHVACNSSDDSISLSSINDMYTAETVTHWTPYSINVYAENNGVYFPGNRLKFGYNIFDSYNNEINATSINQEIKINVQSINATDFFADFPLIIGSDGVCTICNSGVLFITATLALTGNNYSLSATVEDNALFVHDLIDISITSCPAGYGSTGNVKQCATCSKGFFSLFPTTSSCIDCDTDKISGVSCPGGKQIIVEPSYWIAVYGYPGYNHIQFKASNKQDSFIVSNISVIEQSIISGKCATGYCCTSKDSGCDFLLSDSLCAFNRDPTVYLCGKCIEGFSELFGTNACGKCSNETWHRIFIPICFGLFVGIYIVLSQSSKTQKPKIRDPNRRPSKCRQLITSFNQICCTKNDDDDNNKHPNAMTKKEFISTLEVLFTKCIIYYYQMLSNLLLSTNGIPNALIGFVGLFNFDVFARISGNDNDGYCLFSNLTSVAKIVIQLTTTLSIIFFVFLSYALRRFFSLNVTKPIKRQPNFGRAFVKASLLCVGQVLSVLFQLLACRAVGNDVTNVTVHYFFGSTFCYGVIWIIALLGLVFVVLYFVVLFVVIGKRIKSNDDIDEVLSPASKNSVIDENKKEMYHSAVWCFRKQVWYWELVLFVRRLFLALVLIVFDSNDLLMVTAVILMIYSWIHIKCNPFKFEDANQFETYLIGATILLITINANYQNNSVNTFGNVLISLLILFPIFWCIYFVFSRCKHVTKNNSGSVGGSSKSEINEEVVQEMEFALRNTLKTEAEALHIQYH